MYGPECRLVLVGEAVRAVQADAQLRLDVVVPTTEEQVRFFEHSGWEYR
jgi:hypothetical protein